MLNSLVLRALSGFMAFNMAAAPVSTQGNGDVVNARYYGTYKNYNPSDGKIIIDSSGCKLEKYFRGNPNYTYPYANTSYTQDYTINISKFTAVFNKDQVKWVNSNGLIGGSPSSGYEIQGKVEERDEPYAPPRRYIISNSMSYWKDL
ncbi:MAG: hypothetical protein K2N06_12750 [Oscillospiraceae bacterium]|nr:hypothetical protein [Oscillospiraceae bacterium]